MNRTELVPRVAATTSLSQVDAAFAVRSVFETIADTLADGETVTIAGFGTFSTRSRAARQGRDPVTGQTVAIAASQAPAFKSGKTLRDAVNRTSAYGTSGMSQHWRMRRARRGHACAARQSR